MAGKNFMQRNHVSPDCILAVAVVTQCTDRHGMVAKSVLICCRSSVDRGCKLKGKPQNHIVGWGFLLYEEPNQEF